LLSMIPFTDEYDTGPVACPQEQKRQSSGRSERKRTGSISDKRGDRGPQIALDLPGIPLPLVTLEDRIVGVALSLGVGVGLHASEGERRHSISMPGVESMSLQ